MPDMAKKLSGVRIPVIAFLMTFIATAHVFAEGLETPYWARGKSACPGELYYFDQQTNKLQVFTKLEMTTQKLGTFMSFQMSEGSFVKNNEDGYDIIFPDGTTGQLVIIDPDWVKLKTQLYGDTALDPCDPEEAQKLIADAHNHFKTCPKNVLNCSSQ